MSRVPFIRAFVLVLLSALGLALPARAAAADEQPQAKPDLVVMSFNVRYAAANDGENNWDKRKDLACDVVRRQNPDLIGLQEALRVQIDDIRAALPQYGEIGVGREDGKTKGEYSAILYRKDRFDMNDSGTFWLSDTPEVPGSITWGNKIARICTWGRFLRKRTGKPLYLFNTHLDHQSQPSRERGVVLLASRIAERKQADPVLVTGDFNAGESNPAVRYLKGEITLGAGQGDPAKTPVTFIDTFRTQHPEATEVGTFNQFKGVRTGDKIDYVLALPGTQVLRAEILYDNKDNRYPSDHFPVVAMLSLISVQSVWNLPPSDGLSLSVAAGAPFGSQPCLVGGR
jgi:endonuclease/exonuclease/phosphatase family metal-dependent hydrolase